MGLTNINTIAAAAPQAAIGSSAPAALGINDLGNVSCFVKSASGLGLVDNGTSKLTSFLDVAAGAGGLSSGNLTSETAAGCVSAGVNAGLFPATAALDQVSSLLGTAKALGITPSNIKGQVADIMDKAQKNGLAPEQSTADASTGPPASLGSAITCHKLKFQPYEYANILEVSISQGVNEHARLYIKGVLGPASQNGNSEQKKADDQTVQETTAQTAAALYNVDEEGTVECLFQGNILSVKQSQSTDLKYFEAHVISPSYNLDIKKNSRSFQKMTATYDDVIKAVTDGQAEVNNRTDSKSTGKLIVQYKETDWGFLKRMSSHFNTGLVPVINSEKVQIYFGIPTGQEAQEITAAAYKVQKNLGEYRTTQANSITHAKPSVTDADFICYEIESSDRRNIGDSVSFLNHTLYVRNIRTSLEQGMLKHHYTLVSKEGLVQKDLFNPTLPGMSLMAEVKVITKDQIKVHITEIDQQWDDANDWYFPYSTVYSSPDGSGWYCMPEPGDAVRIYFPGNKEEEAVAASSVNRTSQAPERRSDPDKKSLSNKYGKEVLFTPDGIYITNQAEKIFINLTDAEGITIQSEKNVTIKAKENIVINANKELIIMAGKNLKLSNGGSSITMSENNVIHVEGDQVKTNS